MNNKNFTDYIFTMAEKKISNTSILACTEKTDIEVLSPNKQFDISLIYRKDILACTIEGYSYENKHRKAIRAFIDSYNDKPDRKYQLHMLERENKVFIAEFVEAVDDAKALQIVDDMVAFFTEENDVTKTIGEILDSAQVRARVVKTRVDELKTLACKYENEGEHEKAKRCYHEICQKYYGYSHMELIALHYAKGHETKWGTFPVNKEYQLEYQMLAVEKDEDNWIAPMVAFGMAKRLGKTDLCEKLIAIGQERGTWNNIALRTSVNQEVILKRIADCYRNGVGCEKNEEYARYYDRLIAGERQEVFKDMLMQGFEPVLHLMTANSYYQVQSLKDLEGISNELKDQFLYGKSDAGFDLPEWFTALVNGLSEEDRTVVLSGAQAKLKTALQDLLSKIDSGKCELLEDRDGCDGFLLEDNGKLKYVYLPNLDTLIPCQIGDDIKTMMKNFQIAPKGGN